MVGVDMESQVVVALGLAVLRKKEGAKLLLPFGRLVVYAPPVLNNDPESSWRNWAGCCLWNTDLGAPQKSGCTVLGLFFFCKCF